MLTEGALRFASIVGGATWSGPVKTNAASTIGDVQAAAVRRDGTAIFSQDGTGFVNVYQGDNGGTLHNGFVRADKRNEVANANNLDIPLRRPPHGPDHPSSRPARPARRDVERRPAPLRRGPAPLPDPADVTGPLR